MTSWRDEYLVALREQEKNSPVNLELIDACSQLADRVAALEAEKAAWQTSSPPVGPSTPQPAPVTGPENSSSSGGGDVAPGTLARLRLDLAEALRSRGHAQARLREAEAELHGLRARAAADARSARQLAAERTALRTKVRDRDEELRGKTKMLEDLQDEVLALNLQLNVAEQQRAKVQAENKQLIERWMARVGQEAEAMNLANEPVITKGR
ncbi:hypothetical protein NKR23_g9442 [Pleurostoma richardsiae]|uniref:Autophagy-related protein 16 domain-containing protein n=1 Tax=Pleurostoma richardsiae TaxID=41990 RepID=A0AA38VET7_9PEZI|nr:hypothetical protein NKR23_g9442 [Pleurostoma richardsiae]